MVQNSKIKQLRVVQRDPRQTSESRSVPKTMVQYGFSYKIILPAFLKTERYTITMTKTCSH